MTPPFMIRAACSCTLAAGTCGCPKASWVLPWRIQTVIEKSRDMGVSARIGDLLRTPTGNRHERRVAARQRRFHVKQ